jgi:DNA-binding FadR family transcriptional regulator
MSEMRAAQSHRELVSADVNFHLSILRAAGNELLVPFGFLIESSLANLFDYTNSRDNWEAARPLHEAIVAAIRRRKPAAARIAVRRLLQDTDAFIDRRLRVLRRHRVPA